ncbi:MAG TPA: LptF/LptG family permease [Devosia sp.]|nr:LptF/LptG family permease [Devosia sp.]
MTRIDWLILKRLLARIGLVMALLFGLFGLVQSLDTSQSRLLGAAGGVPLVIGGFAAVSARIVLGTLPVSVLIGTIVAVLDLQSRRELVAIKATGYSIWRVLRAPLLLAILGAFAVVGFIEPQVVQINRMLPLSVPAPGSSGVLWFEQTNAEGSYVISAERASNDGARLEGGVTFFMTGLPGRARIEAPSARLVDGAWHIDRGRRFTPSAPPEPLRDFEIPTTTTAGDLLVRFTVPRDLSLGQLWQAMSAGIADPDTRASAVTSFIRQLSLPGLLCGMVLIGFAFTSGYRRTNRYGGAVLYGVVLGFVVYVVTELASRAGFAGVLDPTFAAAGPALVAIVIGLTVLLFREDGRT